MYSMTSLPRTRVSVWAPFGGVASSERSLDSSSERSLDSSSERLLDLSSPSAGQSHLGIGDGVGVPTEDGIGMGVKIAASDIREDEDQFEAEASAVGTREIVVDPLVIGDISESTRGGIPDLEDTIYDIVHYMSEVPLDRITNLILAQS
ncbi:hypothetical protein Tco_0630304 [Tanacetum coccineum]